MKRSKITCIDEKILKMAAHITIKINANPKNLQF